MSKVRKKYNPEEKAKIVLESLKGKLTGAQISAKYGVHSTQINNWCKQIKSGIADIFREKKRKNESEKDSLIEELYKEIGKQKIELEWLKKKSRLFD